MGRTFAVESRAGCKVSKQFSKPLKIAMPVTSRKMTFNNFQPIRCSQCCQLTTILLIPRVSAVILKPGLEAKFEVSKNHFLIPRLAQPPSSNQNEMEKISPTHHGCNHGVLSIASSSMASHENEAMTLYGLCSTWLHKQFMARYKQNHGVLQTKSWRGSPTPT